MDLFNFCTSALFLFNNLSPIMNGCSTNIAFSSQFWNLVSGVSKVGFSTLTDKQNKKVEKAIFLTPCLLSRMVAQCSATSSSYVSFGKVITRPGPSDYYDDDGDDDGCIDDDQEVVATSRRQKKAIFYCHHLPPLWLQWARIAAINIWLECYFLPCSRLRRDWEHCWQLLLVLPS